MANEIKTILQVVCLALLLGVLILAGVTIYRFNTTLDDFRKSFIFQPVASPGLSTLESLVPDSVMEEVQDVSPLQVGKEIGRPGSTAEELTKVDNLELPDIDVDGEKMEPVEDAASEQSEDSNDESNVTSTLADVDTGNICTRTPEIQQLLIQQLQINSCREITGEELLRVRELSTSTPEGIPPKIGDLDGLINLTTLTFSSDEAPVGLFDDLVSLESLRLQLKTPPAPGLFENLGRLQEMNLSVNDRDDAQNYDTQYNSEDLDLQGVFEGLTALEGLELVVNSDDYSVSLMSGSLTGMPNLQELKIYDLGRVEAGAFGDLPVLRSVYLQAYYLPDHLPKPPLAVDVFADNPDLAYVEVSGFGEVPRLGFNSLNVVCRIEGNIVPYYYYDRDFTAVVDGKLVKRESRDGSSNDGWECQLRAVPVNTKNWDIETWAEVQVTVPPLPDTRRN